MRQKAGFFVRRQNQVSPIDPTNKSSRGRSLRSRLSISSGLGRTSPRDGEDIEMQRHESRIVPYDFV